MRKKRATRRLAGIAAAAMISLGVAGPVAFAQYGEEPPIVSGSGTGGAAGTTGTTTSNAVLLKRCIAKAQTKFGDNKPKMKAAIRKCKKKYKH
jgi:hypothetical protein